MTHNLSPDGSLLRSGSLEHSIIYSRPTSPQRRSGGEWYGLQGFRTILASLNMTLNIFETRICAASLCAFR